MRISTSMLYDLGVSSINTQMAQLLKTQQQVATGRRILAPADDPVGAATALENEKSLGVVNQYVSNIGSARSSLSLEETVLSNVGQVLQNARQDVVNGGNPTLSAANKTALATSLRSAYDQLLSLANSRDGQGNYMFSGFKTGTQPFTQSSGAGVYAGDQGQNKLQISASRQIPITDSGQNVFKPGVAGSDPFATIETFITALNSGTVTSSELTTALNGIDSAMNNVLRVRSAVGTRQNELDSTEITNQDSATQYQSLISQLRDVDYTKAISDLTRQQTGLQAAQKSFTTVQGLSLFNYLR